MAVFPVPEFALLTLVAGLGAAALSAEVRDRSRRLVVDYGVVVVVLSIVAVGVWLFFNHGADFVEVLLRRYWLLALFGVFVLEGAMVLYFAPSESLVPVAVGLASTTDVAPAGPVTYATIIAVSVLGATLGQYLIFLLAKRWGRDFLLERPWFRIGDERLAKFEAWFDKWGPIVVPVSNTMLFVRGMFIVPAGIAEMRDRTFVVLSALGTLSFETILALLTLGVFELGIL
ncbi:hypothetical protein BRC81_06815 [Halobacteriales archaeon QS_1_68_20]|nr:MAG: hypothetical protein BRC81_06815 [Halobacteriales archaeon QS_1_68_20]